MQSPSRSHLKGQWPIQFASERHAQLASGPFQKGHPSRNSKLIGRASLETASKLTRTQKIFEDIEKRQSSGKQAEGAGGGTTYKALKGADAGWEKVRNMQAGSSGGPAFIHARPGESGPKPDYDVIVCGGTLGVFLACALQQQGYRIAIVERGPLKGRDQEWNLSRKELAELVEQGLLSASEADECVASEFNPVRAGFYGGKDVWTENVLNIGVRPDRIIAKVKRNFELAGGKVFELTAAQGAEIYSNGCCLILPGEKGKEPSRVGARLLIDCMGNASPIVRQIRQGSKPDGVCLVVGTCSRGFDASQNTTGDVIYTNTPIQSPGKPISDVQYFWEAFPAGTGEKDRTTYMFTYIDADPRRPSLETMLEDYWTLMPQYQNVQLEDLEVLRILFGFFATYRESPLQPKFDRVLQVGDASGIQSPLSFGGFGALSRHLPRLRAAIADALDGDFLDRRSLGCINAYNPGLSSAWMLQRAMSVRPGRQPDSQFINSLLSANFQEMEKLGEPVLKPFLQDVVQFKPLALTLAKQMAADPGFITQILGHVGPLPILDWTKHFIGLGWYTALYKALAPLDDLISQQLNPLLRFRWKRNLEAWKYGSGADYKP